MGTEEDILTLIREQKILREENSQLKEQIENQKSKLQYLVRIKNLAYRMITTLRYTSNSQSLNLATTSKDLVEEFDKLREDNKKLYE